ncbi:MAG TPA: helix-turn-helix domain-containing protein [Methanomicrobia archaeon]|nr:helix-turn-helix domain-containing protein [Methanomicrobia archaeon]
MVSEEVRSTICEYYDNGMHINEIAARLLLDVSTVRDVVEEYESQHKKGKEKDERYSFVLEQLQQGVRTLHEHNEALFSQGLYDEYFMGYEEMLASLELYLAALDQRESESGNDK